MTPAEFWALIWGRDQDLHEVRLLEVTCWIPCPRQRALLRLLSAPGCAVSLVPRNAPDSLSWSEAHLLWCHLKTGDSQHRLERFRPAPTAVLRTGRTLDRWALWSLSSPLSGPWILRATERLSHQLRGVRGDARPETLIPSPFNGRTWVEYGANIVFQPRQVVGHLSDAPDPNAWKQKAA